MDTGLIIGIIVFCALGILAAISTIFIDYTEMIAGLFKNKPWVGYLEVVSGPSIEIKTGKRVSHDIFGEIFTYRYEGCQYEVRIGTNYPVEYIKRKRHIRCRPGLLIALALPGRDQAYDKDGKPYEPQFSEATMSLQTAGWGVKQAFLSLQGKSTSMISWILGGVIVVMLVAGVWYYQGHKESPAAGSATPAAGQATKPAAATPTITNKVTPMPSTTAPGASSTVKPIPTTKAAAQ